MLISVLGPGCPKCAEAEKIVRAAVSESGVDAQVEKVSDFQKIAAMGVFSTPAVALDGNVLCTGRSPAKAEVLAWIASHLKS